MDAIMKTQQNIKNTKSKKIIMENGKIFFTKETERKILFFMTVIMLFIGLMVKLV
jgi:hypothetical protein